MHSIKRAGEYTCSSQSMPALVVMPEARVAIIWELAHMPNKIPLRIIWPIVQPLSYSQA